MKIFERGHKINFVDDKNVFLGFDSEASCSEDFGYILSHKIPTKICWENDDEIDPEGFNFDVKFIVHSSIKNLDRGDSVTFQLKKGRKKIFLTLYNSHNGYYGHGFDMLKGLNEIHKGFL